MNTPIRVLLVDDHAMLRTGIRNFLETATDIEVRWEASDGIEAQAKIGAIAPDVVVLDIKMPNMNGVEFTQWVRKAHPNVGVLILSAFDDEPYIMAVLRAGAHGYVLKSANPETVVNAVRNVAQRKPALDPQIAQKISMLAVQMDNVQTMSSQLTRRELDVLRALASGITNREIGHKLHISDRTVQAHLAKIFRKLNVSSRTEAVTAAISAGLIASPSYS